MNLANNEKNYENRLSLLCLDSLEEALDFCLQDFLQNLKACVEKKGKFTCALSGGSTPLQLFQRFKELKDSPDIPWDKVCFFWGDERYVPPYHADNNYFQAMQAGLESLPIPKDQFFPIPTLSTPSQDAQTYCETLMNHVEDLSFDYVMLGLGEDGHLASLFPHTSAILEKNRLACENHVPQVDSYRITLTFPILKQAKRIIFYVLGKRKQEILKLLSKNNFAPDPLYPATLLEGSRSLPLWVCDRDAFPGF